MARSLKMRSCLVLISVLFVSSLWVMRVYASPAYPPVGSTSLINPTRTFTGDDLYCGAFRPTDPNHAIIAGARGKILKWNGTVLSPIETGAWAWFYRVAWKPDGSYALLIGDNGGLEKWDGTYLKRLVPPYWATSPQGPETYFENVAWKPDGTYALVVGELASPRQATVWKWDGVTLTKLMSFPNSYFWSVAWKPDGSYALISGSSGTLYRYDGVNFTLVSTGTSHNLFRTAWKPDGSYALIVVGWQGSAGKAFKYDGVSFNEIPSGLNYQLQDVAWKPGGNWALVPCYDNGLIYNFTGTGFTLLYNGSTAIGGVGLQSAFWRPDGALAFIVGEVGTVLKYEGSTFTALSPCSSVTGEILYGSAWKPDGSYALIVGGSQRNGPAGYLYGKGIVLKYDGSTLTTLSSGLKDLLRGVAWKPDGSYALICGGNGSLTKFDGTAFTNLPSFTTSWLRNVAWKPDGSYALICSSNGLLWKFDGITTMVISTGITSDLWDVAWKPDGTYALICGDAGRVLKYDGSSVTQLITGVSDRLRGVAWKPTGGYALIVGDGERMLRFDGSTFTTLRSGMGSRFNDVGWKPDGTYAIAASTSNWLRLYDGSGVSGRPSFSSGELYTVAWKPDGSYALIGGNWGLLLRYAESPTNFYGVQYTVRNADDNNLYFILTGYDGAGKRPGVSAPSSKGSNMYAASLLYGLAGRPQKVDYDTGGWVDHSTGKPLVSAIPAGKWILIFGSPSVHNCAYYYTTVSGESPAYGQVVMDGGKQYYRFMSRSGRTLHSQEMSKVGDHEDSAILMTFKDADGRFIVMMYGVGYQGAWAAASYFKDRIWMVDSAAFDGGTYVVHWVDSNMDGVPQLGEIFLIPTEESHNAQYQLAVSVNNPSMGTTNPLAGDYWCSVGSNVQVLATANAGYRLHHWELDGANVGSANPYTVAMNQHRSLLAVYDACAWSPLDGPSPEAPVIVSSSSLLYFAARGVDNRIWYRTMTASGVWSSWTPLLGFTDARPAVAVFNSRLYFFCKQFGANSIWYGYYPLSGGVVSGAFSGWTLLDGPTPSAVSLASSPDYLYVAARGMDGSIWHRRMNAAGAWSGWSRVLGFTDVSPAIAFFNNRLYLVCKQSGAQSIWYGYVDLNSYPGAWYGWSPLGGLTPDALTLASSSDYLYLVARSVDNSIWYRTMSLTSSWSGWSPASGYTESPIAIAIFNGYMHLAARQAGTNNLWMYK